MFSNGEKMNEKYMTVSQLTNKIKRRIDTDPQLKNIYIKGEISNFKTNNRSGHGYFTLKDKNTQIKGIIFQRVLKNLKFQLEDGMNVLIKGSVEIYSPHGQYQLHANKIIEDGVGDLYLAYNQLKEKLNKEGLFNEEKKKDIPKYPKRIGVITATTGAAIRDIITTIQRRCPICEILIFPSLVQGNMAPENIIKQINASENYNLDTLIVGRGGGSIEDLNAFNDENVARAIYNCNTPIISGVGHEIDYTIIDFVADLRAPTPTAAAERAVPELKTVKNEVNNFKLRSKQSINHKVSSEKNNLKNICEKNILKSPYNLVNTHGIRLDDLSYKLNHFLKNITKTKINEFDKVKIQLNYVQKEYLESKKNSLEKIKNNHSLKNPQIITKKQKEKYKNIIQKTTLKNPYLLTTEPNSKIDILIDKLYYSSKNITQDKTNEYNKLKMRLEYAQRDLVKNKTNKYMQNVEKLELLNPLSTLKRGYTLTKYKGKIISSSNNVKKGDKLEIEFNDGIINTKVI